MFSLSDMFSFALPSISLPAIPLPANIQRRFLSFLLRRTIGHLVKPGQLDINQIEAQIGGGKVDIKDVELDPQAINLLLEDLPLQLQDGAIGKVAAQIPLPNIFTAPFALSLSSLHLTFILTKPPPAAAPDTNSNLAESVASVAETFIHDELTERENRILRDSVNGLDVDDEDERQPPGSINPYLDDEDDDGDHHRGSRRRSSDHAPEHLGDDVEGASVFTMIVERLLARFCFNATDTQIRLIHPGNVEYTLRVPEIVYATEEEESGENIVKVRTVRVSGVTVSTKSLRPPTHLRSSSIGSLSSDNNTEGQPSSSSSSGGEDEISASMYQSTVSLYESAISVRPTSAPPSARVSPVSTKRPSFPLPREPAEEVIVSFTSEPIVLRISNIFPVDFAPAPAFSPATSPPTGNAPSAMYMSQDTIRVVAEMKKGSRTSVDVAVGVIASAMKSHHLQGIMATVQFALPNSSSPPPAPSRSDPPSAGGQMQIQLKLKGIVLLLLQDADTSDELIQTFYAQPLSHPIPAKHLRIHMDAIDASLTDGSLSPTFMTAAPNTSSAPSSTTRQVATLTISDLSIFTISRPKNDLDSWTTSPILIHDSNLPYQYDAGVQTSFPIFEVSDWRRTEGLGARPSRWKAHVPPHNKRRLSSSVVQGAGGPAIRLRTELGVGIEELAVQPLHVFVDLESVGDVLPFVMDVLGPVEGDSNSVTIAATAALDVHSTPRAGFADLNIIGDLDAQNARLGKADRAASSTIVVECPMIRVQIRAPAPTSHPRSPPVSQSPTSRSGSLVFDLHNLRVVTGNAGGQTPSTRFSASQASGRRSSKKKLVAQVEWNRLVVSLAGINEPRASALLSIGPSSSKDRAFPVIYIRQAATIKENEGQSMSVECRIPCVNVKVDKATLDGLQLWADDSAQWAERTFNGDSGRTGTSTGNTSMIGSRYFADTPRGMGSLATLKTSQTAGKPGEIVISIIVDEATVRLLVPRGPAEGTMDARPLNISTVEVEALIELKPEGKNETVLSLSVADAKIVDTSPAGELVTFLELSSPLNQAPGSRPILKVRVTSGTVAETTAKKSTVAVTASGFTYTLSSDLSWVEDVARFAKAPPGAFESVVPSERTGIWLKILDGSIRVVAPTHKGALVVAIKEMEFLTELVSEAIETESQLRIPSLAVLFIDDAQTPGGGVDAPRLQAPTTVEKWMMLGYAYIVHVSELETKIASSSQPVSNNVDVDKLRLSLHLCADTMASVGAFATDFGSAFQKPEDPDTLPPVPIAKGTHFTRKPKKDMMSSIDENAFKSAPEMDTPGDMMDDDVPKNLDYLDAEYGSSGGVTAYSDEEDFSNFSDSDVSAGPSTPTPSTPDSSILSPHIRREAIRILAQGGLNIIEDYYDTITPAEDEAGPLFDYGLVARIRAKDCEVKVHLHDGYDWVATRKAIEEEVKAVRRKLLKIRQLLASGQTPDESVEDTHAMLFNSVHIGLPDNVDEMETGDLIAAIDQELKDDELETATQSSWQSLNRPNTSSPRRSASHTPAPKSYRFRGKKLTRSKHSRIDVCLYNLEAEVDKLHPNELELVSRVLVKVENLEILDHIKTSTWKKFLTEIKSDAKGNVRETGSHMAKVELKMVKPTQGLAQEEARLRMKFLPIRLHVDQDALDFLKAFGSFSAPIDKDAAPKPPPTATAPPSPEIYFQHVEVFPVGLKLDYKPKRVDYRALREGKTIELMNFFHFDGAEMTLRHIKLSGVTGWATVGDTLNDLWTPDVKANQLVDVISGIAPIRSVVNVGSGMADLILLPIAQYRKDGRVIRGLQKGATSFLNTTAMEAVKLGAKLATGTQMILEEAENVLGGPSVILTESVEALGGSPFLPPKDNLGSDEGSDPEGDLRSVRGATSAGATSDLPTPHMISRYAEQPNDLTEGMQAAGKSLRKNLNSVAKTILAVPIEVFEKTGNEGAVRKVIKAMPIMVLHPMIGAADAAAKTLMGLRNTMDPENRLETEEKYKR